MKKSLLMKTMFLLCALIVGSASSWATDIESNFTDKNLSVGTGELGWTASKDASSFESSNLARGVQFGTAIGEFTLTSNTSLKNITKVVLVVSTNGTASANTIAVKVGGTTDFTTDGTTKTYAMPKSNDNTVTFSGAPTNGTVVISFNDTNKSIYVKSITVTYSAEEVVAAPTFSPVAGEVTKGSTVTLTQAAADQIRYTLDGTDPTKSTGSVYSSPIVINEATVIKAIAVKGDKVSDVATAAYSIAYPKVLTLDLTDAGWGFPTDNKTDAATYTNNGYTITLDESSNGHKKVISSGTTVSLIFGKTDATLTLPAFGFNVSKLKVYGQPSASKDVTFNVYVGDDAVSTEVTSSKEEHEFVIAADKQAAGTIYTIKVTNSYNCQISKIEVYGNGCEAGVVSNVGWATYVTTCDMEFAEGDAFVVSAANATTATLTGVTKIRANEPVILKGEGAKTAKVLDEAPAAVFNELAISIGGSIDGFVLAKPAGKNAGFYKWNGGSLTSGKVYLPAPTAARDYLEFTFDDDVTSIADVRSKKADGRSEYFNLAGQRVAQPTKGLYIVNGKKYVIK